MQADVLCLALVFVERGLRVVLVVDSFGGWMLGVLPDVTIP